MKEVARIAMDPPTLRIQEMDVSAYMPRKMPFSRLEGKESAKILFYIATRMQFIFRMTITNTPVDVLV